MARKQPIRALLASIKILTLTGLTGRLRARASSNYYSLVRPGFYAWRDNILCSEMKSSWEITLGLFLGSVYFVVKTVLSADTERKRRYRKKAPKCQKKLSHWKWPKGWKTPYSNQYGSINSILFPVWSHEGFKPVLFEKSQDIIAPSDNLGLSL